MDGFQSTIAAGTPHNIASSVLDALAPTGPDGKLIVLCQRLVAHSRETNRLCDLAEATEDKEEHKRIWKVIHSRCVPYHELLEAAARMPALTTAGMRAKAALVLDRAEYDADWNPYDADNALAVSLAKAILRGPCA